MLCLICKFVVFPPSRVCFAEYLRISKLMESGRRLALGQFVLGALYRGLYNITQNVEKSIHGPMWILQVWAWMYFTALSPIRHPVTLATRCYGDLYCELTHVNNNVHDVFHALWNLKDKKFLLYTRRKFGPSWFQ